MRKPLEGVLVLEFCQFLAGPSAGLKLADLGARVIKIERPIHGDACRQLAIKNLFIDNDSLLFHTINRHKESYAADLKDPEDLKRLNVLISKADIMVHNFRPGVMEKIGLSYQAVQLINPKIIYGVVTGYGNEGPWAKKPGQDLLIQSISGLTYLSGTSNDGPVPFGLSVSDIMCGNHLAQGLMAALIKRAKTGKSVLVEVSLLESILDVQFEVITTYLNDGGKLPERSAMDGSAHAYLSAPYGIYATANGYLALAMADLALVSQLINCDISDLYGDKHSAFENRDALISRLGEKFKTAHTGNWLTILEDEGVWCAEVLDYKSAVKLKAYQDLAIEQELVLNDGRILKTTASPIRLNREKLFSTKAAPGLGHNNNEINEEFKLN
ncbi:CaiB/BaiF CoA transferase family protein [Pedobacter insulae]|uniref:Crotonobetainyl-CoA:carnitine CoA-transferase CaiB n=1 Tax=Pedobacter insulae TaxID=414048 RepID=A0A1I2YGG8_9SPHI|nr:CaiB/BaiF CoA-transferase family protein [Pedobacter insulae]SFH24733.1 Crotonobetainyl-CoA:carnitine CoA-transferase CaiB [Pedobacter insulae]